MFRELKSFPSLRNSQSSQFPKIPNFISKIVPVRKPRKVFYAHATCVGRSRLSIFDSIPMASSLAFEPTLESSPSPALRCLDTFGMRLPSAGSFTQRLHLRTPNLLIPTTTSRATGGEGAQTEGEQEGRRGGQAEGEKVDSVTVLISSTLVL